MTLVLPIICAVVAACLWRHDAVGILEDNESRLAGVLKPEYGEVMGFTLVDQWNAATTRAEQESLWTAWTKWRVPAEIVWEKQHKEADAVPPSEIIGSTLAIEELPYLDAFGWHTVVDGEPLTLARREVSHIRRLIRIEEWEETIRKDRISVAVATVACFLVVVIPLAILLLSWRDRRRWLKRDEARPVEERIDEIRGLAASAIESLPKLHGDVTAEHPDWEESWSWVDPVIVFYRRLESLASSKDATAQEAIDLANEAGEFLRQREVKGVFVAGHAQRLARLLQERGAC